MSLLKIRKPHDRWFKALEKDSKVILNDVGSGLYFSKTIKNKKITDLHIQSIRHNQFLLFCTKKPIKRKDLVKYSLYDL